MTPAEKIRAVIEAAKVEFERETGTAITRIVVATTSDCIAGGKPVSWITDCQIETKV
jgi:hypothetical protein